MTIPVQALQDRCRETAGFLFSHPCRNPATTRCIRCSKPICAEHGRPASLQGESGPAPSSGTDVVCIGCARHQASHVSTTGDRDALRGDPFFFGWALSEDASSWSYSSADHEAFAGDDLGAEEGAWERDWDAS